MRLIKGWIVAVVLFVCAFGFLWTGLIDAGNANVKQDVSRVQESVKKAAIECYSVEGRFPEEIQYLKDHYGLYLNEEAYFISYEWQAENLMPNIYVYRKGQER